MSIDLNSRLDMIQPETLSIKLKAFKEYELESINQVAKAYTECLMGVVKTPSIPKEFYSTWAQYTIQLKEKSIRDKLQATLKAERIPSIVLLSKANA